MPSGAKEFSIQDVANRSRGLGEMVKQLKREELEQWVDACLELHVLNGGRLEV